MLCSKYRAWRRVFAPFVLCLGAALPPGAALAAGKPRVEGAQLEGRASKSSLQAFLPNPDLTADRGQCEWTVRAPAGTRVELVARHERAGKVATAIVLQ